MKEIISKNKKYFLLIIDVLMIVIAYSMMVFFRFDLSKLIPDDFLLQTKNTCVLTAIIFICGYLIAGIYDNLWIHSHMMDYLIVLGVSLCTSFVTMIICRAKQELFLHPKYVIMSLFLCFCFLISYRIFIRAFFGIIVKSYSYRSVYNRKKILIIGAGAATEIALQEFKTNNRNLEIVGLIDDDPQKLGRKLLGSRVVGDRNAIVEVCKKESVDEIFITIPSLKEKELSKLISICSKTECKVKIMSGLNEMMRSGKRITGNYRNVNIEDLLERDPITLDTSKLNQMFAGKTVLVTGGGGSIGSELCRQLVKYNIKQLIVFDIYENNAYDIQNELLRKYPELNIIVVIGSVRDTKRLEYIFDTYRPNIVFHAAAHKHVPLMEVSPGEAIKNNVFGTYNTAKCADKYNVEKFILISTDKAVNPTNVMGATKRLCEMIVQSMQQISKTEFAAVRFGNVLGSNGSVIPLFKKQIEEGGPVTLTHMEITRFFMTIPEAAQLVMQAAAFASGGEIFVLDMGKPVKIYDLAVNLIKLSGYKPNEDMEIKITGLRPGEKLYEELLMDEEGLTKTGHEKIFIGKPIFTNIDEVNKITEELAEALEKDDNELIKDTLAKAVPTYQRKQKAFKV